MDIYLKEMDLTDAKELQWLSKFIEMNHSTPNHLLSEQNSLKNPLTRWYAAYLDTKNGSFVVGVSSFTRITPHLAQQEKTIVDKQYRGWGYGIDLCDAMVEEIKQKGYGKVTCKVYAFNTAMLRIKLDQGFVIEGYHPDNDELGLHEYTLGLLLE